MSNDIIKIMLEDLKAEREKFTEADEEKMGRIVDALIDARHYPLKTVKGDTALKMVLNYGVDWVSFKGPLKCDNCLIDLRDKENGPPFKRELVVIKNGKVDGYRCPECDGWV